MRNLIPFYNARTKDHFAHVPKGMDLLKFKQDGLPDGVALSWYLKMDQVVDLNALVHDERLVEQGVIPADDIIQPEKLSLQAVLFMQMVGGKRVYFQAALPTPQPLGRSTEATEDAQYMYGMNISSGIGNAVSPDGYYQLSLVYDTRNGFITSGSKVELVKKVLDGQEVTAVEGELSIIGYLLFGKLAPAEISSTGEADKDYSLN